MKLPLSLQTLICAGCATWLTQAHADKARLAGLTVIDEQIIALHIEEGIVTFTEDISGPTAFSGHYHEARLNTVLRYGALSIPEATAIDTWSLRGGQVAGGVAPEQVHRKTKLNGMAQLEWVDTDYRYEHTLEHFLYLRLPVAMTQGETYTLNIGAGANIDTESVTFTYDIFESKTEAIKLNLVGFHDDDSIKAVDIYMWMGDGGARDYSSFEGRKVYLRNLDTGNTQEVGTVNLWRNSAKEAQGYNLTQSAVWRGDFTGFKDPGRYRVAIQGLGASQDFEIRPDIYRDPFLVSVRGFFYMRIGQDSLDMAPVPRRPLLIPGQDGFKAYETTLHPWSPAWKGNDPWDRPSLFAEHSTGVEHPQAWGGHSDALDWDRHLSHVSIIYDMLLPYLLSKGALDDDDLGIAESGNGIPDVIDAARYEVDFFLRLKLSTGGYSHGMSNPEGNAQANYRDGKIYLAAATGMAAWANAANAAMLADAFRMSGHADLMAHYRDEAILAYQHALSLPLEEQQLDIPQDIGVSKMRGRDFQQMAAAFLYNVTGDLLWEEVIHAESVVRDDPAQRVIIEYQNEKQARNQIYATAAYLGTHRPVNFPELRDNMRTAIVQQAVAEESGLRTNRPSRRSIDIHSGYFQTVQNLHRTLLAHAVTLDPAQRADFLDALVLEADWGLGRNPLNMIQMTTATTPLATRRSVENAYTSGRNDGTPGLHPGHTPYFNTDDWWDRMVMGRPSWITSKGHPAANTWPKAERIYNTRFVWAHSEFTPHQTMRGKQALYGYLYSLYKKQGPTKGAQLNSVPVKGRPEVPASALRPPVPTRKPAPAPEPMRVYSDAENRITGVWGDGLKEVLDGGFEGKKHYQFTYTIKNWWAGLGLNLDNWGTGSPIDLSGFEVLSLAVRGPSSPEHVLTLQLVSPGGEDGVAGAAVVIPPTKAYARVHIPLRALKGNSPLVLTRIKELRFSVSGVESGEGTFSFDEVLFLPPGGNAK